MFEFDEKTFKFCKGTDDDLSLVYRDKQPVIEGVKDRIFVNASMMDYTEFDRIASASRSAHYMRLDGKGGLYRWSFAGELADKPEYLVEFVEQVYSWKIWINIEAVKTEADYDRIRAEAYKAVDRQRELLKHKPYSLARFCAEFADVPTTQTSTYEG